MVLRLELDNDNLYTNIYNNIDNIKLTYNHILNPTTNIITKNFLKQNYSEDQSYTLSFMLILMFFFDINNIKY
jgi:hypothetical protein